jgi:hypothetical protein
MDFYIWFGALNAIMAALFLITPKMLIRMSSWANQHIFGVDERAFYYRIGIGISFLLIGLTMFFLAYWHYKIHGSGAAIPPWSSK